LGKRASDWADLPLAAGRLGQARREFSLWHSLFQFKDDSEGSEGRPNRVDPFRLQIQANEQPSNREGVWESGLSISITAISSAFPG
jgi:hypothetical protein